MRPPVLALIALVLVLAGCGDDGDDGDDGGDEANAGTSQLEPCGALTAEAVQQLTGVEVESTVKEFAGGATCSFSSPTTDEGPSLVVVSESRAVDLDELVAQLSGDPEETSVEPLEIAGADEAAVLEDNAYGIASRSFIATTPDGWYSLSPFQEATREDEVRVGVAALGALLGGEIPPDAVAVTRDVPHPCVLVTAATVSRLTGTQVESARFDEVEGLRQCDYADPGEEISVTLSDVADRVPVDAMVAGARTAGAEVEEVTAPGVLEAYVVTREELDDRVTANAATEGATYALEVRAGSVEESGRLAAQLIEALGAAG